jgi:hypothetical protein
MYNLHSFRAFLFEHPLNGMSTQSRGLMEICPALYFIGGYYDRTREDSRHTEGT